MAICYKVPHPRGPNLIDGRMIKKITSSDGKRWAYSRRFKISHGDKRYGSVVAWVLRRREMDGSVATERSGVDEAAAKRWIKEGKS